MTKRDLLALVAQAPEDVQFRVVVERPVLCWQKQHQVVLIANCQVAVWKFGVYRNSKIVAVAHSLLGAMAKADKVRRWLGDRLWRPPV